MAFYAFIFRADGLKSGQIPKKSVKRASGVSLSIRPDASSSSKGFGPVAKNIALGSLFHYRQRLRGDVVERDVTTPCLLAGIF